MGVNISIEIASSGMSAQRRRLEVIASNLANARLFKAAELESSGSAFGREFNRQLRKVSVTGVIDDPRPPLEVYDPSHPDADANGYVRMPNINVVDEMINMIGAARSYEASLEVMKTAKRMSNAALELGNA